MCGYFIGRLFRLKIVCIYIFKNTSERYNSGKLNLIFKKYLILLRIIQVLIVLTYVVSICLKIAFLFRLSHFFYFQEKTKGSIRKISKNCKILSYPPRVSKALKDPPRNSILPQDHQVRLQYSRLFLKFYSVPSTNPEDYTL